MSRTKTPGSVISWIMRRDLQVFPADEGNGTAWTVKDPVRLTYFRVETAELEFLRLLDGCCSLESVTQQLSHRFPELQFVAGNLAKFLTDAIRARLLIPVNPGYGQQLAGEQRIARSTAVSRKLFSLLSHRFRGIDPTCLLQALDRRLGWVFHRRLLVAAAVFVLLTTCLVAVRWSQVRAELPALEDLLTIRNVVSLALAFMVIRILHEIGHGLTCCHYGGECHELGCIVVGCFPLLYCDVSDSWLQQNRIYRIQVAAAGIAVELFLAAVFGMLWMASIPGMLHSVFLNVMLVCSLNTILINGNPLLRYDGYYILSDLLRQPNLGPESRAAAAGVFDRLVLGLAQHHSASAIGFRHAGLVCFGLASGVYRLLVLVTILLVLHSFLKPYRLEAIVWVPALSVGSGLLLMIARKARQRSRVILHSVRRTLRAAAGVTLTALVCGTILFWPLPHSVEAPFTLTPGVNTPIYVSTAGSVQEAIQYGDQVVDGQVVVKLNSAQLELELAQLEGELAVREASLVHLAGTRSRSAAVGLAIPAAQRAVRSTRARLSEVRHKASRLTLRSPGTGFLYPPRTRRELHESPLQPQFWQGRPLDRANCSTWLEAQTLLGWVGSAERFRATVYLRQQDIEFVAPQADVRLMFNSQPSVPLSGSVERTGSQPESVAPAELLAGGLLPVKQSIGTLMDTRFVVHVQFTGSLQSVPPLYSTGFARITCQPASLAARCWRILSHTFAFEM